jgi:phage head maturation protease
MSNELFFRSMAIDGAEVNEADRTLTVSFSSELPVARRYYGDEILLHGEKNVNLDYLNTVGSVLRRHNGDMVDIIGPVKKAWIQDRRGMAVISFDNDENGNTALQKIKAGSLRGISFGYQITRGIRLEEETDTWIDPETKREYTGPAVIGIEWRPHEITLTPIPADHTVGFNRSLVENIQFENDRKQTQTEETTMEDKEIRKLVQDTVTEALRNLPKPLTADEIEETVRNIVKDEQTPKIQVDRDTLADLSSRAVAVSDACKSKVFDMALEGRSHIEMLTFINDEAVKGGSDAKRKHGAGDDQHDKSDNKDQQFRTVADIPDELFTGAFRSM